VDVAEHAGPTPARTERIQPHQALAGVEREDGHCGFVASEA
jgi:hypothetical protein